MMAYSRHDPMNESFKRNSEEYASLFNDTLHRVQRHDRSSRSATPNENTTDRAHLSLPPPTGTASKKTVRFAHSESIFSVRNLVEYSDRELDDIYFSRDDFATMRHNSNKLIRQMQAGHDDNSMESDCIRGLEGNTREYAYNRRALRRKLFKYISSQRGRLLPNGKNEDIVATRIAGYCRKITTPSANAARTLAVCDALEVRSMSFKEETNNFIPVRSMSLKENARKFVPVVASANSSKVHKNYRARSGTL